MNDFEKHAQFSTRLRLNLEPVKQIAPMNKNQYIGQQLSSNVMLFTSFARESNFSIAMRLLQCLVRKFLNSLVFLKIDSRAVNKF